jgi:hypothetical protein
MQINRELFPESLSERSLDYHESLLQVGPDHYVPRNPVYRNILLKKIIQTNIQTQTMTYVIIGRLLNVYIDEDNPILPDNYQIEQFKNINYRSCCYENDLTYDNHFISSYQRYLVKK